MVNTSEVRIKDGMIEPNLKMVRISLVLLVVRWFIELLIKSKKVENIVPDNVMMQGFKELPRIVLGVRKILLSRPVMLVGIPTVVGSVDGNLGGEKSISIPVLVVVRLLLIQRLDGFFNIVLFRVVVNSKGKLTLKEKFRESLTDLGFPFIQEFKIGRYSCDFDFPQSKIILEVDGEYWHRKKARDARKEWYIHEQGWQLIRITQSEIENTRNLDILVFDRLQGVVSFQ